MGCLYGNFKDKLNMDMKIVHMLIGKGRAKRSKTFQVQITIGESIFGTFGLGID